MRKRNLSLFLRLSISGSSSIKVRDEASGNAYTVGAHNISSAFTLSKVNVIAILLFMVALLKLIEWVSMQGAVSENAALLLYCGKRLMPRVLVLNPWANNKKRFGGIVCISFLFLWCNCFLSNASHKYKMIHLTKSKFLDEVVIQHGIWAKPNRRSCSCLLGIWHFLVHRKTYYRISTL